MNPKPWYKSKTVMTNLAVILVTTAGQLFQWWGESSGAAWALSAAGLVNVVLRFVTKGPVTT